MKDRRDNRDLIDWDNVMKAPRNACGHEEIMQALFKNAKVHCHWQSNNLDGSLAYCYKLDDEMFKTTGQRYLFTTDYFGSCSSTDIWENANDKTMRNETEQIVFNNTIGFTDENEVREFFVELKKIRAQVTKQFLAKKSYCAKYETMYYKFLDCLNLENSF